MLRFLKNIEWPGRRVRPGSYTERKSTEEPVVEVPAPSAPRTSTRQDDALRAMPGVLRLIPTREHTRIREALARTRQDLARLRRRAHDDLDNALHIPVSGRPALQEAVSYLSGHHPDFGHLRNSVPDDHKIWVQKPEGSTYVQVPPTEINRQVYERALGTIKHADRIMYGFDVTSIASTDYDGTVPVYGPITDPAEASGEITPVVLPERKTIDTAIDERMFLTKREIIWMIFLHVMEFVCDFFADQLDFIADRVENALTLRILGKKIGIGKYVAWPFRQLASLFRYFAEWFREKAEALIPRTPQPPEVPEPEVPDPIDLPEGVGDGSSGGETEDSNQPPVPGEGNESWRASWDRLVNNPSWKLDRNGTVASGGLVFLMSAEQVTRAVANQIEKQGEDRLLEALTLYHESRESDELYNTHRTIAYDLGVDVADLPLELDYVDVPSETVGPRPETGEYTIEDRRAGEDAPSTTTGRTPVAETYAKRETAPFECGRSE